MEYWVYIVVLSVIYIFADLFIAFRSKNIQITKRSPLLMHVSLLGNLVELISAGSVIPQLNPDKLTDSTLVFLRDSGVLLGHYMFFLPYVLRSYRIYSVFSLEKNWEKSAEVFEKRLYRTRQRWLVQLFCLIILIPAGLCLVIFLYRPLEDVFPITTSSTSPSKEQYASAIYIFICFLEQSVLVFMIYLIRNVENKFNMKNELIFVCFVWSSSSIFSAFVDSDRTVWFMSCVARNLLIFLYSDLYCIVLSYKLTPFSEGLTIEMLNSLDIILENEKTLESFERFLKNLPNSSAKDSGYALLGFYKEIECRIHVEEPDFSIHEVEMATNYSVLNNLNRNSTPENLRFSKDLIFQILQTKYYRDFLKSEECAKLRRVIQREEVISYRVSKTSLLPIIPNTTRDEIDIR